MSTPETNHFLLVFRGTDWYADLPAETTQQIITDWMAWFDGLKADGKCLAGNPLHPEGKIISGKNGRVISDGPFVEAKETIGGYFLLNVSSMDEAVAIAQGCPGLPYGIRVEVRPIAGECPLSTEHSHDSKLARV